MKAMTVNQIAQNEASVLSGLLGKLVVVMALPLLSVIGLLVILAIRLNSTGPVFMTRTVMGAQGTSYKEYRFRCVYMDATQRQWNAQVSGQTSARDPRVTAVGAFLLNSGLNKLPRVINVLKGDIRLEARNF